jgi:hypothetical protein
MNQTRWLRSALTFACVIIGALLLGTQGVRVSSQASDGVPATPAPLPTTVSPTLLQFPLTDRIDPAPPVAPARRLATSAAVAQTQVLTAVVDTMITQGYPTANCSDELEMRVGYDTYLTPDGRTLDSLVWFNLASIPAGATVQDATLELFLSGSYDYPGHNLRITPYRISSPWSADSVTWNTQPSFAEAYTSTWVMHGSGVWCPFDVTDLVRQWAEGTYPNYGLTLVGPAGYDGWRAFAASETIYPPRLRVTYESSPHFTLTLVPDTQVVRAGQHTSSSSTLYLTAIDGFSESTTLHLAGLPPGATYTWSASTVTPTASTLLTITTAPSTPRGVYTLTISGIAPSLTRATEATLRVSQPDFALSVQPSWRSVKSGTSAAYTAYLTATDGFSGAVALDVEGLPLHSTSIWESNPVTPTDHSALTIVTTLDTPAGTHPLTVTGTSGEIVHSARVSLDVSTSTFTETVCLPLVLRNHPSGSILTRYAWQTTLGSPRTAPRAIQDSPVSRIALLIGIADYEHMGPITTVRQEDKTHDLGFPVNDLVDLGGEVTRYCDCAVSRTLSPSGNCGHTTSKSLADSQATKGAIHTAIVNWMDPLEDEDTLVMISFSGHGMYAPDEDGDEDDPYDEFIVPYDIDLGVETWRPETAISDDEFASWLGELESRQIVVFIDSCFAGGMVSSTTSLSTKSFSWQPAAQFEATAEQWRDSFLQDIEGAGTVVLAAATEAQGSWEFGALRNGVFTYYLAEALHSPGADENSNGWISAEEAHRYLDGRVDSYVWNHTSPQVHQNPQIGDGVSGEVDITRPVSCSSCPSW